MQSQLIAILLASVAIGSCLANPSLISGPSRMMEIMRATSENQRNNPQLAAACFAYYNDVFNSDYATYEVEYNQCHEKFNGGREEVLERYDPVVWDLSNSTFDSCMYLLDCDNHNNSQNALNCYASDGPKMSKQLTSVASNASNFYGALVQEVEQLSYTRDLCCNTTARNYEIRSGDSYEAFQSCLAGLTPVPTIPPSTTTLSTTTPSTTTPSTTTPSTTTPSTTTPSTTASSTTSLPTTTTTSLPAVVVSNEKTTTGLPPTILPSTISHFGADGSNSANSKHRWGNKLSNIFKHIG
ncbi:G8 domain-containing protein DDB_G0286311-like [Drosophila elegans]|uniref:G8 domain-containing protein DDB_G0286311-like n=1 Tax=Drosophila elegans TaxID=30023 RepID=UPI0007E64236|nr:G8 domain-containing protein DDB_G0286311-like [Drosophila elegans]